MVKVKALVKMNGYAEIGESGKVTKDWKDSLHGERMRSVVFKKGGYAIFGDKAFDTMLKIVK